MAKKVEEKFNKSKAVRESLGKLGMDAKVDEVIADVKEVHGVELDKATVSQYRSLARKKAGVSRKGRKPGRPKKVLAEGAAPAAKSRMDSNEILGFMEDIKAWEAKLGAKTVQKAFGVLYS